MMVANKKPIWEIGLMDLIKDITYDVSCPIEIPMGIPAFLRVLKKHYVVKTGYCYNYRWFKQDGWKTDRTNFISAFQEFQTLQQTKLNRWQKRNKMALTTLLLLSVEAIENFLDQWENPTPYSPIHFVNKVFN